jgi:hypothetical protein
MENFLKIELLIRGKEKIDDSLAEMIIGELMDGETLNRDLNPSPN